ncbi:MAG: MarR family transcriptional regulator [Gammaproteobacteria bacterium]|nr:MarR family transcriptional regulator [Gammaproteobacteria bacterium]
MTQDPVDILLSQWSQECPEQDLSGLSIVVRLQALSTEFMRETEHALAKVDLQHWEYDVLSALRRQGGSYELAASELARETLLSPGAMTNRIDKLESRGFVSRHPDPGDRRGVLVSLTKAGLLTINTAIDERFSAAKQLVEPLSGAECQQLTELLRKLVN